MPQVRPQIEAFIFDLFGVIIAFDNDIVYSRLASRCADPQQAFRCLDGLMAGREIITGQVTLHQVHRRLTGQLGLAMSFPEFEAAWLQPYSTALPGMAEVITALAGNYRLVLLSNVDPYYWQVVREMHPELGHFDAVAVSCDLGLAKPDAEIFVHASQIAGAEPAHCFLIDDTAANIEAARALGFQTHLFTDTGTLRRQLREANITGL